MTTSINVETLSETVGRIVDKDVTTDKNKEISEYVHRIIKYLCLLKKKNKIQKKYILEAEGGPRNSTLSMYFLSPRYPQCRGFFVSKKAPHVFECRADSFIIFL